VIDRILAHGAQHPLRPARVFLTRRLIHAFGLIDAVTFVLAGGAFHRIPPKMRFLIGLFWTIVRINRRVRRRQGRAESRLEY
jgi:acyl-CoA synthetase (AMP-forming)/AMP-acid ligase II